MEKHMYFTIHDAAFDKMYFISLTMRINILLI